MMAGWEGGTEGRVENEIDHCRLIAWYEQTIVVIEGLHIEVETKNALSHLQRAQ